MNNLWKVASLLFVAVTSAQASSQAQPLRRTQTNSATPKILKLRLIDANTDLPIPGYDPIVDPSVIDVGTLPSPNLSVEAITEGSVGSIQWDFNGAIRNEDSPVWALCGNNRTDFFACQRLKIGTNATIKATPYSSKGASGNRGQTASVRMALYKTNVTPPVSMSFTLINADTDTEIGPLRNDTVVDIVTTPRINIRANVEPSIMIASVQFTNNGVLYRTENGAPYAFQGNSGNDYFPWSPTVGRYTVQGSAFSERDAKGTLWSTELVTFTVIKTASPTTRAPVPSPMAPVPSPVAPIPSPVAPIPSPVAPVPSPVATSSPSSQYDRVGPKLIRLEVLTPTVDVSKGPATGTVRVVVQDDRSGIGRVALGVSSELGRYFYYDDVYPTTNSGGKAVTFNMTLKFERYIRKGRHWLFVLLRDTLYNSRDYYYPALADNNFTNSIEVLNTNEDLAPPELLEFSVLGPTVVDVSKGPASLTFKVVCRDLMYGVKYVDIFAFGGDRRVEKLEWLDTPLVGTKTSILRLEFPAFSKSGNYSLQLDLADADYNIVKFNATQLSQRNLTSMVTVVNANEDVTAPTLVNFTSGRYPSIVNTTSGYGSIAYYATVSDTQSGFYYGSITATYDTNQTIVKFPRFVPSPIVGEYTFSGFFDFTNDSWKGNYTLSVSVQDELNNIKTITSAELIALGFPGYFTVV